MTLSLPRRRKSSANRRLGNSGALTTHSVMPVKTGIHASPLVQRMGESLRLRTSGEAWIPDQVGDDGGCWK